MLMLLLGVALFSGAHLMLCFAPGVKTNCVQRMGEGGFKGIFSLSLLASFALMIMGWRSIEPDFLYHLPPAVHSAAMGLLTLAFILMVVSSRNSRLRQWIRHPQLTGVALWGVAHLMMNGDSRSLVLFGGLSVWAVLEIIAISRREGKWVKPEVPGLGAEVVTLLIALVVIAVVVFVHPWLSGMPVR